MRLDSNRLGCDTFSAVLCFIIDLYVMSGTVIIDILKKINGIL